MAADRRITFLIGRYGEDRAKQVELLATIQAERGLDPPQITEAADGAAYADLFTDEGGSDLVCSYRQLNLSPMRLSERMLADL